MCVVLGEGRNVVIEEDLALSHLLHGLLEVLDLGLGVHHVIIGVECG